MKYRWLSPAFLIGALLAAACESGEATLDTTATTMSPDASSPRLLQTEGTWTVEQDRMVSGSDARSQLQLPIHPPREYVVSLRVKRLAGNNCFGIVLPVGEQKVLVALDAWGSAVSGLENLDGHDVMHNLVARRAPLFIADQEARVVCIVRMDRIQCTFNGTTIFDWWGDPARLSLPDAFAVPDRKAISLLTIESQYAVRELRVTSLADVEHLVKFSRPLPPDLPRESDERLREVCSGFGGDQLDPIWKVTYAGAATGWDYTLSQDQLQVSAIRGTAGYAVIRLTRPVELKGQFESELDISWKSQEGPIGNNAAMQGVALIFRDSAGNVVASCGYIDENVINFASPISAISTPERPVGPDTITHYLQFFHQAVPPSVRTQALAPNGTATIRIHRNVQGIIATEFDNDVVDEFLTAQNESTITSIEIEFRHYVLDNPRTTFDGLTAGRFSLTPNKSPGATRLRNLNKAPPAVRRKYLADEKFPVPPRWGHLLTGLPKVRRRLPSDIPDGELEIVARVEMNEELAIYPDRLEWTHVNDAIPLTTRDNPWPIVRINGTEWIPQEQPTLRFDTASETIPSSFEPSSSRVLFLQNRGNARAEFAPDHVKLIFQDRAQGAGEYMVVVRPPIHLPSVTVDADTEKQIKDRSTQNPRRAIPNGRTLPTQRDYERRQATWKHNRLKDAYERYGKHSPAWDEKVHELLAGAARNPSRSIEQMVRLGQELMELKCDDPLVAHIYSRALWLAGDSARAESPALHAVLAFRQSAYPRWVTRRAPALLACIYAKVGSEKRLLIDGLLDQSVDETADVCAENLSPEEARVLYAELLEDLGVGKILSGKQAETIQAICRHPAASQWLAHMLIGWHQHFVAAQFQGDASAASEENRSATTLVQSALGQARAHYVEAWRLHPEFSEAATALIDVLDDAPWETHEPPRFWFDEAVAVQIDPLDAHAALLRSLAHSHKEMLEFSLECVRTGRFDTSVPRFFLLGLWTVKKEGGNVPLLLRELGAEVEALAAFEAFEQRAADADALRRAQTESLILLQHLGWPDEAKKRLVQREGSFDASTLQTYGVSGEFLRDQLMAPAQTVRDARKVIPKPQVLRDQESLSRFVISPDNRTIVTTNNTGPLTIWDLSSGNSRLLHTEQDERRRSRCLSFSPQGKYLAFGQIRDYATDNSGGKSHLGSVSLWDPRTDKVREILHEDQVPSPTPNRLGDVRSLGWFPGERYLVVSSGGTIAHPGGLKTLSAIIVDVESGKTVAYTDWYHGSVHLIAVSPDSTLLACGHGFKMIRLTKLPAISDLEKNPEVPIQCEILADLKQHKAELSSLELSPDGKILASGDRDGTVWLWDVAKRVPLVRLEGKYVAFSPDSSRIATAGGPPSAPLGGIWTSPGGEPLAQLGSDDGGEATGIAFQSDGNTVVISDKSGRIRFWDVSQAE